LLPRLTSGESPVLPEGDVAERNIAITSQSAPAANTMRALGADEEDQPEWDATDCVGAARTPLLGL
jgi:hypothetical protein